MPLPNSETSRLAVHFLADVFGSEHLAAQRPPASRCGTHSTQLVAQKCSGRSTFVGARSTRLSGQKVFGSEHLAVQPISSAD